MGGESITQSRRGSGAGVKLGKVIMILDLHRQGLTVSAIALARSVSIARPFGRAGK
jgi:hypothetical protein